MKSKTQRRKPLRVSIPAVNVGMFRGERVDERMGKLERRREKIEDLELQGDELEAQERLERKRDRLERGEGDRNSDDTLTEKIVDKVILPLVNRSLEDNSRGKDSVASEAIKLAEKALDKTREGGGTPLTLSGMISSLTELKDIVKGDEALEKRLDDITNDLKELKKKPSGDLAEINTIEKVLNIVDRVQQRVRPDGGGSKKEFYDFETWKVEFGRKTTMQDRAFTLRMRQQDKDHDLRLAELGIKHRSNDLLEDGIKRIGSAIARGLSDEDFEDEEPEGRPKEGAKLIKYNCPNPNCGAPISVPPEAQVVGRQIKCTKCDSILVWEEE